MPRNNHTFRQGETFNGTVEDETIVIREVREHTVVWDYQVNGKTLNRSPIEKEKARTYIQSGYWNKPLA